MKKIVSAASAVLLATSLAACNAYEAKVVDVEVPASTSTSTPIKSEARTKITIEQFLWDREIVCRPNPDGLFSAYWDGGSQRGYTRAEAWDETCNENFEPVTLQVTVVR